MICSKCQAENREGARFCRECAQLLPSELVSAQCGHQNIPGSRFCNEYPHPQAAAIPKSTPATVPQPQASPSPEPTSFADGGYRVKMLLGNGSKKKVYLAHDTTLNRDIAFALIKTDGLEEKGKARIQREARAIGRLGDHPSIVTIYDVAEHEGQPYLVLPVLPGGDVEGLIKN